MIGNRSRSTLISDISARMPPSPSLFMLMATQTYLTVTTIVSVQKMKDTTPSSTSGVGAPPERSMTDLERVESGLYLCPRTRPRAPRDPTWEAPLCADCPHLWLRFRYQEG